MTSLKHLLVGSPIRTARLAHERLTKKTALAIFASDALSSTAYATEQILLVLAAAYLAGQGLAFAKGLAAPADGRFRFLVQDPLGIEQEINVEISGAIAAETVWRTRGQIQISSEFWMCCAERRLANYVMEHAEFPPGNEMIIESLDREDLMLAIRWGKA